MTTAGAHYLIHCHLSPSRRTGRRQTSIRPHRGPSRNSRRQAEKPTPLASETKARDPRPITSGPRRDQVSMLAETAH